MPWLMGIDEAGYGPNLGPFVMSGVLFHLPQGCSTDLWKVLNSAVRKANTRADGRLVVDDSKQVYSPKVGIGPLEKNLWPFVPQGSSTFDQLWQSLCLTDRCHAEHEPYINWTQTVPLGLASASSAALLRGVLTHSGVQLHQLKSSIVFPRQFNQLTREADSKAAVPLTSIKRLLNGIPACEPVEIMVDRLGGRQRYAQHLSDWFPQTPIHIEIETPELSRYRVGEFMTVSFQVKADQHSFPVALASMLSKYWRELMMSHFNSWFSLEQPGITPTAGYPLDASRFWKEAEPVRQRRQLLDDHWWRER